MKSLFHTLYSIKYNYLIWSLAFTATIHNIEESIWLPELFQSVNGPGSFVSPVEFRLATLLITLLIWLIIWYFVKYNTQFSRYLLCGTIVMILLNVFFPHLIGTMFLHKYLPGIFTGIILNVPVTSYLLWRGFKEDLFDIKSLSIGIIAFIVLALPVMLGSFLTEEFIEKLRN